MLVVKQFIFQRKDKSCMYGNRMYMGAIKCIMANIKSNNHPLLLCFIGD